MFQCRSRRWARLFDETTWPEVLRRYLVATRAHRVALVSLESAPQEIAVMDNDSVALLAGVLLGRQHFQDLSPELHIRLLRVLVCPAVFVLRCCCLITFPAACSS